MNCNYLQATVSLEGQTTPKVKAITWSWSNLMETRLLPSSNNNLSGTPSKNKD
jgi:hypothetical protein